jgi:hypothetical protein
MATSFSLTDSLSLDDLHVYLSRAARIEDGSARLIANNRVLAVYTGVFFPIGLLDESPTVLGLRTFALADDATFDVVVPLRSLIERIVRLQGQERDRDAPVTVGIPMQVNTATWAAISPPRGGWHELPDADASALETTARAGIDEIAQTLPDGTGEQIVHRVRSEVWGRGIPEREYLPAGAAFGAFSLGFLGSPPHGSVSVRETGPWTRLSTPRGHILVRRRGWTLQR